MADCPHRKAIFGLNGDSQDHWRSTAVTLILDKLTVPAACRVRAVPSSRRYKWGIGSGSGAGSGSGMGWGLGSSGSWGPSWSLTSRWISQSQQSLQALHFSQRWLAHVSLVHRTQMRVDSSSQILQTKGMVMVIEAFDLYRPARRAAARDSLCSVAPRGRRA